MPRHNHNNLLVDVASKRTRTSGKKHLVNLSYEREIKIPLTNILKFAGIFLATAFLFLGSASAPVFRETKASVSSDAERAALESQLNDLKNQIDQYEGQISTYKKQGGTLKSEIANLDAKIAKINLQIKATNLTLAVLSQKMVDSENKISVYESQIESNRGSLTKVLQDLYKNDRKSTVEIFLASQKFSDFVNELNGLALVQQNLGDEIGKISDLRDQEKSARAELAFSRADTATLKQYQESQKNETASAKTDKNSLLDITKGQESKYQALLKQTKETAAQIRSRIFQLLGGGELTFEQAYRFAKLAGDATGVRPAFILAVLDRESALGQNIGKCSYKTAMKPQDIPIFLDIVSRVGLGNPDSVFVSCANKDGAYGGAMGPAQFIPSTWEFYKDGISKITGHSPASPWNNGDAFVAAALYLANAGAANNERVAAAKYYCGGSWNRYVCTEVYGRKVTETAAQFQDDINTILG